MRRVEKKVNALAIHRHEPRCDHLSCPTVPEARASPNQPHDRGALNEGSSNNLIDLESFATEDRGRAVSYGRFAFERTDIKSFCGLIAFASHLQPEGSLRARRDTPGACQSVMPPILSNKATASFRSHWIAPEGT